MLFIDTYSSFKLKLIWYCSFYTGKIMDNTKQIKDYKVEEKNFVVIMVTKVTWNLPINIV